MPELLRLITPEFLFTSVVVAIFVNLLSNYLYDRLQKAPKVVGIVLTLANLSFIAYSSAYYEPTVSVGPPFLLATIPVYSAPMVFPDSRLAGYAVFAPALTAVILVWFVWAGGQYAPTLAPMDSGTAQIIAGAYAVHMLVVVPWFAIKLFNTGK